MMNPFQTVITTLLATALFAPTAFAQERGDSDRPREPRDPAQMFERLDQDKSGEVTKDECPDRMWERVAKADTDGSGGISKAELSAFMAQNRPARGPEGEGKRGGRPDGDGKRPEGGTESDRPRQRPNPDQMFERLDKDKDGEVTEAECPDRRWERISKADADASGGISKAEWTAFIEQSRKERDGSGKRGDGERKRGDGGRKGPPEGERETDKAEGAGDK